MKLFLTALLMTTLSTVCVASTFQEGVHYIEVNADTSDSPSIMLFHSPFCAPCAMVHQPIVKLSRERNIDLKEVLVAMGPLGKDIQDGYVTARQQNKEHTYISTLIRRIHFTRDQAPKNREEVGLLLKGCGVNTEEFDHGSQCLHEEVGEFNELVAQYRIRSTPTIIVNGSKQVVLNSLKNMAELEALILELYQS